MRPQYTLWISARKDSGTAWFLGGAGADRRCGAHPQSGCARVIAVSRFDLRTHADRQVSLLCAAGAVGGFDLGVLRHSEPRARGLLFARRLRDGHVSDARDRPERRVWRSRPARLHGVPQLEVAAVVLVWLQPFRVRAADDGARAGIAGVGVRVVCVPVARHRRVFFDHHPGAHLRPDARVLPQRHGLWRQQRIHRFQGHPGFRSPLRQGARRPAGDYRDHARRPATWCAA